jgi:DNA end-binding protein Ku
LLHDALADAELVGIASYAARGKQYIVMVRPFEDGLAMHQLRYADEIKPWDQVPVGKLPHPVASELALARQVIDQLREDSFDPKAFKDDVKQRVRGLIAEKAKGGEIVAPPEVEKHVATDLMAALKASLAPAARGRGGHHPKNGHRPAKRALHGHRRTGVTQLRNRSVGHGR